MVLSEKGYSVLRLVAAAPARSAKPADEALVAAVSFARRLGDIVDAALAVMAGGEAGRLKSARPFAGGLRKSEKKIVSLHASGRLTAETAAEALKAAYMDLSGLQGQLPDGIWFAASASRIERALARAAELAESLGENMAMAKSLHEGAKRRFRGRRPELRLV